ncbi:MAG: PadR family transcriptional regulator [Bacilli bacterium]|nr:PadR family transcriptional regulator [Bacilli bacterium]
MNIVDENILQNLILELRRGTQILAVLSQLEEMKYGYSLLQDLEAKNIKIEAGTLYPLLRRLEAQKLLKSEWDTSEARPRKYYVLSEKGKEVLLQLKQEWSTIVQEMSVMIKGEAK